MTAQRILVVVHPGSCCGSARMNLGRRDADATREGIEDLLNGWSEGVVILDGALSDELPDFPRFDTALTRALERARYAGRVALRRAADDPDQVDVMEQLLDAHTWSAADTTFELTGAWWQPDDGGGCVGSVLAVLTQRGYRASVSAHVMELTCDTDTTEADDGEEGVDCLAGQMDLPACAGFAVMD